MAENSNQYGSFGGVPDNIAVDGSGAGPINVRATPEDFGAQVGGAVEGVGKTIGTDLHDEATQYVGMQNETAANNAESQLIQSYASRRADFMSLEGQAAVDAQPKFLSGLDEDYQNLRSGLNGGALRQFDANAIRQKAVATGEAVTYGVQQQKNAFRASHLGAADALTLQAAQNPTDGNINEALAAHTIAQQVGVPDNAVSHDPDTGATNFSSTPEGQQAKAQYQASLDAAKGDAWHKIISATAAQDPLKASQLFSDNLDRIPVQARAVISSQLAPQVIQAYATGNVHTTIVDANRSYTDLVAQHVTGNASSVGSNPYNLGNVKTPAAAANNTAGFVNPSTPTDGVILTANTLRNGYQGMTLAQIGAKWAPSSENNTSAWVTNVSKGSGISPDTVPNLNDPATLKSVLKGISVAEKSPQDRENFNDAVLEAGVNASLSGQKPKTNSTPSVPGVPKVSYPQNEDGTRMTQADYMATHRQEILSKGEAYAEQTMPGDTTFKAQVRERLNSQISQSISDQTAQYHQDNLQVMRGINGSLTGGTPPATFEQLYAIRGMKDILDRVPAQDPKFADSIPVLISQRQKTAGGANSKDVNTYGKGFFDLMRQVHAGAISPDQLLDHLPNSNSPGDLTMAGHEALLKEFPKDPQGQALAASKSAAFDTIKKMISNSNPALGIADPVGEQKFQQALPTLVNAMNDGLSKGLSVADLTDKTKPTWIGNSVSALMRTPVQQQIDLMHDKGGVENEFGKTYQQYSSNNDPAMRAALRTKLTGLLYQQAQANPAKKEIIKQQAINLGLIVPSKVASAERPLAPISE